MRSVSFFQHFAKSCAQTHTPTIRGLNDNAVFSCNFVVSGLGDNYFSLRSRATTTLQNLWIGYLLHRVTTPAKVTGLMTAIAMATPVAPHWLHSAIP